MDETKSPKSVSNVYQLDPSRPIPTQVKGFSHIASKNYRYLPFLGDDDNFFEILSECRTLSVINNACISTKTRYSVGSGWTFKDDTINKKFKEEFAKCVNKKGDTLNDILKEIFENYFTFGNVFVNIVKVSVGKTKKVRIFVKNNFDSRLASTEDPDVVTEVIFSSRFREENMVTLTKDDQVEIPLLIPGEDIKWKEISKGESHACIHLKNKVAGLDHYGMPTNVSSTVSQQLEYKGERYNLDNFENNMVLGGILVIKSSMSETEASKHAKNVTKTHTGDGKRGRVMVLASEQGVEDSIYHKFDTANDGSYLGLDKRLEEKIIIANEWDPVLAGIKTGSALGRGEGYFKEIFELRYNTVIRPAQEYVIEKFLEPLLLVLKEHCGLDYTANAIDIMTPSPVSYGSDIDISDVMTIDEGRSKLGLEVIGGELGKQIISHSKGKNVPVKQP